MLEVGGVEEVVLLQVVKMRVSTGSVEKERDKLTSTF